MRMAVKDYKISVPNFRLTYKDLFVFKPLYRVTYGWFRDNTWTDKYGGMEFYENFYIHRETGGGFYDITINWEWHKKYMDKNFDMIMVLDFVLLGGRIEERRIDDKKVKGESGELSVFINPRVEIDDQSGFKDNPILARSKARVFERQHRETIEQIQGYTYSKAKEVFDMLKSYLDSHGSVFGMDMLIHRKWEGV